MKAETDTHTNPSFKAWGVAAAADWDTNTGSYKRKRGVFYFESVEDSVSHAVDSLVDVSD